MHLTRQARAGAQALSRGLEATRPVWIVPLLLTLTFRGARYIPHAAALVLTIWVLGALGTRRWWRATPFDLLWLVWVLLLPVTFWATADPAATREAARYFAASALAYWVLLAWARTPARAAWATLGLTLAAAALAALGLLWTPLGGKQMLPIPPEFFTWRKQVDLPVTEEVNPNVLAGLLVPLWPLPLALLGVLRGYRRWLAAPLLLALASGMAVAVVLTQSRGAMIAMALALIVLLALHWRVVWGVFPLGGVVLGWLAWTGQLRLLLTTALASSTYLGIEGRVEVWSRALYAAQDFFFTGIGMGTFSLVIPILYPYFTITNPLPHAHNLFLQVAVDLGIFGLIAFVGMVVGTAVLVGRAIRYFHNHNIHTAAWVLRGGAAGLVAALVHGTVDAVTWNTRPAFLAWALWGLVVGIALIAWEEETGYRDDG